MPHTAQQLEIPASVLMELVEDPKKYNQMIATLKERTVVADKAEAAAKAEQVKARAAEAKAEQAQTQAQATVQAAEVAQREAEAAKSALVREHQLIASKLAAAEAMVRAADELTGKLVSLLRGKVAGFASEAAGLLDDAMKGDWSMPIRDEHDAVRQRAAHRITYTMGGNKALNMAADSTQTSYLIEGPNGRGWTAYFEFGHPMVFQSTSAVETFLTSELGGSIP